MEAREKEGDLHQQNGLELRTFLRITELQWENRTAKERKMDDLDQSKILWALSNSAMFVEFPCDRREMAVAAWKIIPVLFVPFSRFFKNIFKHFCIQKLYL